jgi:hypothetical protein
MSNDNDALPPSPRDEGANGDVAVVGESSAATAVSIQTLQGIYNELTGKSEKVSRSYSTPIQVTFPDLEHLNHKISQVCEQYNLLQGACSISLYYTDDSRDNFSSFDRFRLHACGSSVSVESVLFKYNFLVILPKTKKPQTYEISIRLASRTAVAKRMSDEFYAVSHLFRVMGNRTATVDIEYVDYMVARNFLSLIDEWFKTIPAATEFKPLHWLQARSHLVPRLARFGTTLFAAFLVVTLIPRVIPPGSTDLALFARALTFSLLGVYVARTVAGWCSALIETALNRWTELSYIKITKGDEIAIERAKKQDRWSVAKGVGGFLLTFCTSLATKIIANKLVS